MTTRDVTDVSDRLSAKQRLLLKTVLKDRARAAKVARARGLGSGWDGDVGAQHRHGSGTGATGRRNGAGVREPNEGSNQPVSRSNRFGQRSFPGPSDGKADARKTNPLQDLASLLLTLVGDVVDAGGDLSEDRRSPLVGMRTDGARPPFFCAHALLGSTFHYHGLTNLLDTDQPFYALQAPGLDGEERGLSRIEDFAAFYIPFIREVQPHGPYRLGGYSFGGLVAYEMARQLHAQGEKVSHLIIFGTDLPVSMTFPKLFKVIEFAAQFGSDALKNLVMPFFSYDKRIEAGQGGLSGKGGQGGGVLSPTLVRVVTAHCIAAARYVPQPFPGRITLLETLEQQLINPLDAARGWDRLAAGGVETMTVSGNHLSMLDEPHIQDLARKLETILATP